MLLTMTKRTTINQKETTGQRLARIRKERGYTQIELAEKAGLLQAQISDYERGRSNMSGEIVARIAQVLQVPTDELLGLKQTKTNGKKPPRKILRRLEQIEHLPRRDQQALFRTIDVYLQKAS